MHSVHRGVVALLAVCLLAVAAVPLGSAAVGQSETPGQESVVSNTNGSNYLSAPGTGTEQYDRIGTDVASAASIAAQEIHSRFDTQTYSYQLQTDNESRRRLVAAGQLDRVEARFAGLAEQQAQLYRSYANGEISKRTLLRNLVVVRIVAETQVQNFGRAAAVTDLEIGRLSQLETLSAGLTPEQPVVDRVRDSLSGADQQVVYVAAAGEALTLAMVSDDEYVRQATVLGERDLQGRDQFKLDQNITIDDDLWATPAGYSEAQDRLAELYPWSYDRTAVDPIVGSPLSRIYKFDVTTPQGVLTTYFDGATRNVFHETQIGPVTARSTERVLTNNTAALNLSVAVTHESGPLRISVEDGAPVPNAVVRVDGQIVGQTDAAGRLWTIQPRGSFELTVTTADEETATISGP